MLNVTAATSLLMIFFIIDLLEKSRTPVKDAFLTDYYIRKLVLETLSVAHLEQGISVSVGDMGEFCITQAGSVVGFQSMLEAFHRSTMVSWMGQWNSMLSSNILGTDWAAESLPLLDVVVFIFTVIKVRRRQNKSPWQENSLKARKCFLNALAKVLENTLMKAIVGYMQHNDVYNADVPSRQLRPAFCLRHAAI